MNTTGETETGGTTTGEEIPPTGGITGGTQ